MTRAAWAVPFLALAGCAAWAARALRGWREGAARRCPVPGPGPDDGKGCMTDDEFISFLAIAAMWAQEGWNERNTA